MNISELKAKQGNADVEGSIIEKGSVREFQKFGKVGRVSNAKLQDASGKITLTLWNEQIEQVSVGDKVKVTNGYVGEWQGELQLSTGKFGKLDVVEKGPGGSAEDVDEPVDEEMVE